MSTVYSPQYRINLLELFSVAYAENPARDIIRPLISQEAFKSAFGKKVIEKIQERTLQGIDRDGKPFAKYSDAYRNSLVFKIYHKTSQVNMKLSGEMLASMAVTGTDYRTYVTIEFVDNHNKNKAHGNITGRLGKTTVRDFFGLPKEVELELLKSTIKTFQNQTLLSLLDNADLGALGLNVGVGNAPLRRLAVGQNDFMSADISSDEDILQ